MLNIFKKGTGHLAIVVEDPHTINQDAQSILQAMQRGGDMQLSASFHHGVIGITTLEKIVEQILSMSILDEKDLLKTQAHRDLNHFSLT